MISGDESHTREFHRAGSIGCVENLGRFGDQQNSHGRNSAPNFWFCSAPISVHWHLLGPIPATLATLDLSTLVDTGGSKIDLFILMKKYRQVMAKGSTSTGHFLLRPDRALHQEPRYETVAKQKVSPSREMGQEQHFAGNGMKLGSSNLNRVNPLVNNPQDISRSEMDGKNSLQNWRFTVLLGLAHESSLTGVWKSEVTRFGMLW